MKITLEFDASEDFDQEGRAIRAMKADAYLSTIWDVKQKLRGWWKYGKSADEVIEEINELVNAIDFDADGWQ
jgi:hypothetical protein